MHLRITNLRADVEVDGKPAVTCYLYRSAYGPKLHRVQICGRNGKSKDYRIDGAVLKFGNGLIRLVVADFLYEGVIQAVR